MWIMRYAMESDAAWILGALPELERMYGARLLDSKYAAARLPVIMRDHCCLVAERNGERLGFVAGLLVPHVLNPAVRVLAEILWWVDPNRRGAQRAQAGLRLLDAFVDWGRGRADWILFSLMTASRAGRAALARRGFRPAETVYLLEV